MVTGGLIVAFPEREMSLGALLLGKPLLSVIGDVFSTTPVLCFSTSLLVISVLYKFVGSSGVHFQLDGVL